MNIDETTQGYIRDQIKSHPKSNNNESGIDKENVCIMQQFIDNLISRLEERIDANKKYTSTPMGKEARNQIIGLKKAIEIVNQLAAEYKGGWIPCSERLPEYENKDRSWVRCIVKVMRSHYPTSTYDDCDSPYDETFVMCAMYDVKQKIWHLDSDEQLNALIDIEDAPMNGDYVIEWMPLPKP